MELKNSTDFRSPEQLHRLLVEVYGEPEYKTTEMMNTWRDLYDLPVLTKTQTVDASFISYWQRTVLNFVVVAVFNYRDEHLIIYSPRHISESEIVG